jgi:hypothetical protein
LVLLFELFPVQKSDTVPRMFSPIFESFRSGLLRCYLLVTATLLTAHGVNRVAAAQPLWSLGPPAFPVETMLDGKPAKLVDPCLVRAESRWHVFASANGGTVYFSTAEFPAGPDTRLVKLPVDKCFVPQVFYFRAQARWQLIGMMPDPTGRYPKFVPCLCTNARIDDPSGWSKPEALDVPSPEDPAKPVKNWIDFWVIGDGQKFHLFATSADGRLWRSETSVDQYPHGWSKPVIALTGDFIYASHTYRHDTGTAKFITILTAKGIDPETRKPRQYQQSYVAERLEGPWTPASVTIDNPFAGKANIRFDDPLWTGEIVHGEPLRTGSDERMILEAEITGFIFHGGRTGGTDSKPGASAPAIGLLRPIRK